MMLSSSFFQIAVYWEVPANGIPFMRGNGRAGETNCAVTKKESAQ